MADFWDKEELVGKLAKNNREEIQIKKVEKKGKQYLDIRVFWFDSNEGDFKPSQKGLAIPAENYDEFMELIKQVGF